LILFGTGDTQSIIALHILVRTIIFTWSAPFARLLEATDKQLIMTKIAGISVVVNILLNLVLIPKFSLIGATISTVLTEIILVGSIFRINYNFGYGIPIKKKF